MSDRELANVSAKMPVDLAYQAHVAARLQRMSLSEWLRQAATEKLQRESVSMLEVLTSQGVSNGK